MPRIFFTFTSSLPGSKPFLKSCFLSSQTVGPLLMPSVPDALCNFEAHISCNIASAPGQFHLLLASGHSPFSPKWYNVSLGHLLDRNSYHCPRTVYQTVQAARTKCHTLGSLNNRHRFSHSSRGGECKVKVLAEVVSPQSSLLALRMMACLPSARGLPSACAKPPLLRRTPVILIGAHPHHLMLPELPL